MDRKTTADRKYSVEIMQELREFPGLLCTATLLPDRILMGAALVFCLVTMFYADMTVTGPFSVILWDSVFDGKLLSFYTNCLASGIAPEGAVYDIGLYVVFAIWNLPVWILHHAAGLGLTSPAALLWYKILPVLYTLAGVVVLRDIAVSLGVGKRNADAAGVIYLLSSLVVMPVFVTAQYDCITVYFMLKGLQSWLAEGKTSGSSPACGVPAADVGHSGGGRRHSYLYWFAISLVMKPMGILILFLMVILRRKRLLPILLDLVKACSLLLVCKLVYSFSAGYQASAMSFQGNQLESLLGVQIDASYGGISLFVLGLIVVYAAAFLYDGTDPRMAVVLTFFVWAVFCAFGQMTCYWMIYLAPFLILVIFLAVRWCERLLLAEWICETCLTMVLILNYSWVYGGELTYTYLLLQPLCGKIVSGERQVTVAGFLRVIGMDDLAPALMAVVAGCLLMTGLAALRQICGSAGSLPPQTAKGASGCAAPLLSKADESQGKAPSEEMDGSAVKIDEGEDAAAGKEAAPDGEASPGITILGCRFDAMRCHILLRTGMLYLWILITLAALYYMVI